jgi:hypothetical protein
MMVEVVLIVIMLRAEERSARIRIQPLFLPP